jgi:streptomycin 6-kinase
MTDPLAPWLDRWGLALDGPPPIVRYQGAGDTGQVAFVSRGDERLVLKLVPGAGDETRMGAVLGHWGGEGAVRLIASEAGAILMERARPGGDLFDLLEADSDDSATVAACDVMAALRRPAPGGGGFRTVADWGAGFARNRAAAVEAGIEARLIDRAEALFQDLCASQAEPILLHGDLHHHNIVRDAARGWLAIDPKGILGEPAYETGALLRNPIASLERCARPEIIARRTELMAGRLGYDVRRIIGWCFAQWVLADLWAIEDHIPFDESWLIGPRAAEALL